MFDSTPCPIGGHVAVETFLCSSVKGLKLFVGQRSRLEHKLCVSRAAPNGHPYSSFASPLIDLLEQFLALRFGENARLDVLQALLTSVELGLLSLPVSSKRSLDATCSSISDQPVATAIVQITTLLVAAEHRLNFSRALHALHFEKFVHFG